MRKLIIAAMVAGAAMFANAALVLWNVDGFGDGDTDCLTYFFINSQSAGEAYTALAIETAIGYAQNGEFAKLEAAAVDWGYIDGGSVGTDYFEDAAWKMNDSVSGYAIAFNVDDPDYLADATKFNVTGLDTVTFNNDTAQKDFVLYAGEWKDIGAVPEPTSGLLLLLGVAGLALRRRRA